MGDEAQNVLGDTAALRIDRLLRAYQVAST